MSLAQELFTGSASNLHDRDCNKQLEQPFLSFPQQHLTEDSRESVKQTNKPLQLHSYTKNFFHHN